MRTGRLDAMTKGWFVGDFEPSLLRTAACEVAVKAYRAGEREDLHHHRVATEVTAIVSGTVRMGGREFGPGDAVVLDPGEPAAFEALTDAVSVVVKLPSLAGDKYPGMPREPASS